MSRNRAGFTLTEMIVALAVVGMLIALLIPAVLGASDKAQARKALSKGTAIYKSVFAAYVDEIGGFGMDEPAFPTKKSNGGKGWTTSSAYFTSLLENEVMAVDWAFFAVGEIEPQKGFYGDNPNKQNALKAEHNAWVVVNDPNPEKVGGTFMFTRNVPGDKLVADMEAKFAPKGPPFGANRVVAIFVGGGAAQLSKPEQFRWANLNASGDKNTLLRP